MPAPLAVYLTCVALFWICVSGEESRSPGRAANASEAADRSRQPPVYAPRQLPYHRPYNSHTRFEYGAPDDDNVTSEAADPRSPIGRVPPYLPASPPLSAHPHFRNLPNPYNRKSQQPGQTFYEEEDADGDDGECHTPCFEHEFSCQLSCTCIPLEKRCDGKSDCAGAEDEAQCSRACDLAHNRTLCHGTNICISLNWLCDGDNDCGDYSDETHCDDSATCGPAQFQCGNGLCIHKEWVCDGDNDCRDDSDESNCTKGECRNDQFACAMGECIALHWRCDKDADCPDNSDEAECPTELIRCGENELQCDNKKCIRKEFLCDGDNDCGDWTDEDACPMLPGNCNNGEFKCSDGKCIPDRWRCDTERDCSDGGDELNCAPNQIHNCTDGEFTCTDRKCILKTWVCDGVRDCASGEDEAKCLISCEADQYTCNTHEVSDAFRRCVNRKHICDGIKDCPKGDDEEKCPIKRECTKDEKCEKFCITTHLGKPACDCPLGFLLNNDSLTCRDIDECMFEQDPVCSQTCSNTVGSFQCGCMTGYVLRPDKRSCKPTGESPTLLFSNRVGIRQVWLTGDNYVSVVKGLHNAVALDYHYEKKLIFWTENNLKVIRVSQMNTNNMSDVIRWGLDTPSGVAVDWIHDLLFWTDSGTRRVEVATLDGRQRAVIAANDLDKPRAIAVHPGDALVFWTDWGPYPKIERADMDGSRRKSIIVDDIFWPNGLTIDFTESKIYWADAKHHVIERATFDGRNRKRVTEKGLPHPFALTLFEDAIYWTDWHTKSISTVNKNTGMGIQTVHASLNVPMDIHSYHPLRQIQTYRNHCQPDNGGCSHLCLPNRNNFSCRCPVGYNLNSDGRNCEEMPEKLLLYARQKDLRLKQLDARKQIDSLDMVIPVDNLKSAIALDWDHNTNSIFWTDMERNTISRAFLNGTHQITIVGTNLISPAGLAYDWMTDKLYWTDAGTNCVEVANSDGTMRSLLVWEKIEKPRDIVVDPKAGYLYWSDWGSFPSIERAEMTGENRVTLISGNNMSWPNGLAIDSATKRIYWTDGKKLTIEYANLDGSGRTVLIGQDLTHPFGLDVYGEEVFWTDWESQSIQAANKRTGKNRRTLGSGVAGIMDVVVYHRERVKGVNRCAGNGGCSHLCLLKPRGHSCACPIGIKLNPDGKSCADRPSNFLIFAHRVDIRLVSLDVPYIVDVVLPLPPLKNALGVDVDTKTGLIYWTDTGERKIQSAEISGKQQETVISKGLHTADGIAIDSVGRKIYWTDGGRNSVEVAELDGSNRKVLVWTGLDSPRAIAVIYELGYMFWSDWGTSAKIERADMDGKNRRVLVDHKIKWPNGIAIDATEGRIYWNDAKVLSIESSDFEGNLRDTIVSRVAYPYGLVVVGPHVYWTDWKTKSLNRADKKTGENKKVIRENLEGLMNLRAVQNKRAVDSVCGTNNGGCSHLCLRNPEGFSCACPTGIDFEVQNKTVSNNICKKHPDNFLVFATRGSIATISLDTPEQWDVTLPIKDIKNTIAVDFHWDRKLIFFTDVHADVIRSVNMLNMRETKVVIDTKLDTPNGLGVDWIANNIYWTDNEFKVIEVARLDGTCRKTLISNLNEPRALALFPAKAYLFWTDWGESPSIERSLLDGSQRRTIVEKDLGFPNGITIDYRERRLYWTDALKDRIDTSDLEGQHRVQIVPVAKNPFGMTQFKDHIYWTDWYKKSVMRADKRTGMNVTMISTDLEMAMEIKAVSESRQNGWNPCREDNGGCSHLCLYRGHEYICACPDALDSTPCSKEPKIRVELKMPPHYPSYFDYSDADLGHQPAPTVVPDTNVSVVIIVAMVLFILIILLAIAAYFCVVSKRRRGRDLKEHSISEPDGHISFHNPNYNCADDARHERRRFQGIFKYDKSQEIVTNVYIPEGTSLLPPPPPAHRPPARPPTHDDFEPVTLHSFA